MTKFQTFSIPPRMYTSEVLALARFSASKLNKLRKEGKFPDPICRGTEAIYSGKAVYRALGLIDEDQEYQTEDPIMKALESI